MTDLADIWVPEPQNNSKNNGTNFTRGHMGQIPVIRCFGGQGLSYGATPICTACTVYPFGGGVGIVVLADSRRQVLPGRPVPSLFKVRQGV